MEMTQQKLEQLVKWCTLDAALINGRHLSDCIGPVTKTVTYDNNTVTVNTGITNEDIASYNEAKISSVYA